MNAKTFLNGFLWTGAIVLVISLVVSYLYGLLVHGAAALEWESSARLAIIFGIALPLVKHFDKRSSR